VNAIGKETYNPMKNSTPKKAGFGERQIRLNMDLSKLEFRT
jgi:hypothetical protein